MSAATMIAKTLSRSEIFARAARKTQLSLEFLEDRNAPANVLDMSWSTSSPYAINPIVPVAGAPRADASWEGGHGVALGTASTLTYSTTVPQLTPEQQYARDHRVEGKLPTEILDASNEVRLGDSLPATAPTGAKILRTTAPGSSIQSGGRNQGDLSSDSDSKYEPYLSDGTPLQDTRAPNDFVYYRDNANQRGTDQGSTSTIGEPSLGSVGRTNFYTGNWYASVSNDHGTNYTYVNPYSAFTDVGGSFCCDQRVAVDDDTNQLFWYLQYSKNGATASSFGGGNIARAIGQDGVRDGAWVFWSFTPASFGLGTGLWLDYPHITVAGDHLYASSNVFTSVGDNFSTSVVWRILLSELQTGGSINYTYWVNSDGYTRAPLHNDDSLTTYFASIGGLTTSMKVWTQVSSTATLSQTTISGLNTTFTATPTAASPDGNNWGSRAFYSRDVGAWSNGTLGGVSWNSSQGTGRPRPFIRHTLINLPALTLNSQPDIWYNSSGNTAMYGVFAANARGHYAGNYYFSSDTTAASLTTWVQDDIGNVNIFAAVGTNSGTQWGDYGQTYQHINYNNTWISSGYILTGPGAGGGHQPNVQTQFTWFGRERDTPAAFLSAGDVADTMGLSSTILSGDGTASRSDSLWNAATGKQDQDIYRWTTGFGNTRARMRTYLPTNGYGMDTILRLFNSGGTQLTFNDDFGGAYSEIKYNFANSGTYYMGVSGYSNFSYNPAIAGSGTDALSIGLGDYTFEIFTEVGTSLTSIAAVTPDPRNTAVSTIDVTFSRQIDLATFNYLDLSLTRNGGGNLITNAQTISFVSGTTYRISGLGSLTGSTGAFDGNYVLTVNPAAINDIDGYPVYNPGVSTTSWTADFTPPTVISMVPISPDPRNTAVSTIRITFSEPIASIFYSNIPLTLNGSPVTYSGNETFNLVSGFTYDLGGLTEETALDGTYLFTCLGAGLVDNVGNVGVSGSVSDSWVMDTVAPVVISIVPISPDPRNTAVSTIRITFSELISFIPYAGIPITLNGGSPITYSGNETFTLVSGSTYDLGGLTEETLLDGTYLFTCLSAGLVDYAGNVGVSGSVSDSWVMDTTAPFVTSVQTISPDPRNTTVNTWDVTFSEAINAASLTSADFALQLGAGPNLLTGSETISFVSGTTYRINGLPLQLLGGVYTLTISAAGVQDLAGNFGTGFASDSWTLLAGDTTPPTVTGLFLDGSAWNPNFRIAAGSATYGYPAQTGPGQLTTVPWSTINRFIVTFSEPISGGLLASQVGVRGINVATYTVSSVTPISATDYQINLSAPIDTDWLIIDLNGVGATGVKDLAGNNLAGTFTENVSAFPTTGLAGVNFKYRFKVAVGDADRNGIVRNADKNLVNTNLFVDFGNASYNIYADIDGNSLVRNADKNIVTSHLFVDAPTGGGPSRPGRGGQNGGGGSNRRFQTGGFVGGSLTSSIDRGTTNRRFANATNATSMLDVALADFV